MADSLIDTVMRGIAMRAWGNVSLAVLIKRRVSLIIVIAVCCLRQLSMPIDNKMSLVSDLGDVCFCKMAVRCLNVAPGKLSIWMSSISLFGMRAKLESPVIIISFFYRRGPHSGFAVRRGVYAGLVVGSTEHRGREKGRRSRGLATQTFPHWDKGNNSRSGQRRRERARVNLQATCE